MNNLRSKPTSNLTKKELKRLSAVAYMEIDRQDDYDRVEGVGNAGGGYVVVRGKIHLPSLVEAIAEELDFKR